MDGQLTFALLVALIGVALFFDFLNGLHDAGLKLLFQRHGPDQAMSFLIGREVYRHLERVLDGFEDVADEIQGIVIDHA